MRIVEPKVFLVGETRVIEEGLQAFLDEIGVSDWVSDAPTDVEGMIELMGRNCYRSFAPGLNRNVRKIREHNSDYLANVLGQEHGSVLEHSSVNFVFTNVSRVFTHELVRHRAGTAISQESLRFVRLHDLALWPPLSIREDEEAMAIFARTFEMLEKLQLELAEHFGLDAEGTSFHYKKMMTSAMRRLAPIGLGTTIGWTANVRTLRWVLENRTAPGAEEEIRLVFDLVGEIVVARYPNAFCDFTRVNDDGERWDAEIDGPLYWWKPKHRKV